MDGQKPTETPTQQAPSQLTPGETVAPQPASLPPVSPVQPTTPLPTQAPTELPVVASPDSSTAQAPLTPAQSVATPINDAVSPEVGDFAPQFAPDEVVRWTASEFIAHHKTGGWYALLLLGTVVISVLAWLVTRDVVSTAVVLLAGGVLATYAARPPRQLTYQLDPSGLSIGQRHYNFNEFKSFSVIQEGAFTSVMFTPLKRFGTFTSIYYDPQDEARILDMVSQRLPHEERQPDMVDRLMRRIRF